MPDQISDDRADKALIENAVRTAALAAAKGVPMSEAYLASIVAATSDPSLSVADRIQRATSMAEQYVTAPKPLNVSSATPQELAAQAQAAMQFAGSSRLPIGHSRSADAGKSGYAGLSATDPRALQGITVDKFKGSQIEGAGLDFGTLSYLRGQDRTFTSQNILNAANDAKALGFSPKDRAAMFDHTTIDRYDSKARVTNRALQDYQEQIEGDDTLADLHDKAKAAKTPEERKAIQTEAAKRRSELAKESGLTERLEDKSNHPKAKAATQRRKTAIEKKAEKKYEHRATAEGRAAPVAHTASKSNVDLFKKLTQSPK
jgi:hypothetical protein